METITKKRQYQSSVSEISTRHVRRHISTNVILISPELEVLWQGWEKGKIKILKAIGRRLVEIENRRL